MAAPNDNDLAQGLIAGESPQRFATPDDAWADRGAGMRCRSCMFFVPKEGEKGRCRRHAPTMNGYPVVFTHDWCGDHKLR